MEELPNGFCSEDNFLKNAFEAWLPRFSKEALCKEPIVSRWYLDGEQLLPIHILILPLNNPY